MSKNNYEKAKQLLQEYAACKQEKADMHERMKDIELDLKDFANDNKALFDSNGTLEFPEVGKLRFATKTALEKLKKFSPTKFWSKYRHFCSLSIPVAGIKKAMEDPEVKKELEGEGIRLKNVVEFKVEV